MSPQSIREYIASFGPRYRAASRAAMSRMLDEFCELTGRHRKSAVRRHRKNDQAYAEQKNWAIVRRLIGYERYSSRPAYEELRASYRVHRL